MRSNKVRLFTFIVICLLIGVLGSVATRSSLASWYEGLKKPPFNPPNWIFAPVWTFLYVLMAIAGWRIWNIDVSKREGLRFLFAIQLFLNGVWPFLFFGLRNPAVVLVGIVLLWIFIFILALGAWRVEKVTGFLLIPYLTWVSFAVYLNGVLWWLNR